MQYRWNLDSNDGGLHEKVKIIFFLHICTCKSIHCYKIVQVAASWSRPFIGFSCSQWIKVFVSFLNFRSLSFHDRQVHDRDHNHGYVTNMSVTQCISYKSLLWNCTNLHKLEWNIDEILIPMMEVCTKKLKAIFFSCHVGCAFSKFSYKGHKSSIVKIRKAKY